MKKIFPEIFIAEGETKKKKKFFGAFFILFFVCVFANNTYANNLNYRDEYARRFLANYSETFFSTTFMNFPSDEANAVLQTRDGFMWFGGYNGLYRYDGSRFTVWNAVSQNGFGSSSVRTLFESSDGVLWIGTNDRGLAAYENESFAFYGRAQGVPSNSIRTITECADGRIFAGTLAGLFYIDRDRNIFPAELDTPLQQSVVDLSADENGNIFVVLNSGELFAYTRAGKTLQFELARDFLSVGSISGEQIVAATRSGSVFIFSLDANGISSSEKIDTPLINISKIFEDSNGYIWLPAENGIGFLDKQHRYQNIGNPSGYGFYSDIWEDYQNNYWITGTHGCGIVNFSVSTLVSFNALNNLETGAVNAIVLHDGFTYIGTNNGLIILDEEGKPFLKGFSEMFDTRVRGIFSDSKGNIWICTYSNLGVVRFTPSTGAYKSWTTANGLATDQTHLVHELPNGVIVVGTSEGVNFIKGERVVSANEALETDAFIEMPNIMVLS
ncbi:MAG: hypothetical protein FWD19_05220, partial [Defluviitaleaceae bacterium]|nr:hypothetical protein [Defluviitaleaceae bacterium]